MTLPQVKQRTGIIILGVDVFSTSWLQFAKGDFVIDESKSG
jgi:hypothetical protein